MYSTFLVLRCCVRHCKMTTQFGKVAQDQTCFLPVPSLGQDVLSSLNFSFSSHLLRSLCPFCCVSSLRQHSEGSGFATNSANEGYNSSTSTSSTSSSTSTSSTRSRDNVDVGGSSSGSIGNTSKNNAGKAYLHNTGAAPGKRQQRLFVAGDHAGTSLVVPTGFVASAQVCACCNSATFVNIFLFFF